MSNPIRWYYLLSSWIFVLSVFYPIHKISTFPLNIIASIGCLEFILNPFNLDNYIKILYILFIHIAPFFWIPYDLSYKTIIYSLLFIIIYLIFILGIRKNVFIIYYELLKEKHKNVYDFIHDRFG